MVEDLKQLINKLENYIREDEYHIIEYGESRREKEINKLKDKLIKKLK